MNESLKKKKSTVRKLLNEKAGKQVWEKKKETDAEW